jgi:uncharacterized protein (TIGR02996 family)
MEHSSPEFRALLEEAKSEPDDDVPRQVLADWLQDHDDPRGEFLFVQIRRARLPTDDPEQDGLTRRERQLLGEHALTWLGPLADLASGWAFRRGFVVLQARAERLLTGAANDLALRGGFDWVEELGLSEVRSPHLDRLADSPILDRLTCLDLSSNRFGSEGLERLGQSNRLIALRELRLAGNRIMSTGARNLAEWPQLEGLFRLDLSHNRIDDVGALALARSEHLDELTGLDLRSNDINHEGVAALRSRFGDSVRLGRSREM